MAQALKSALQAQIGRIFQHYRGTRAMCRFNSGKDLLNPLASSSVGNDYLYNNLKNASSTKNVLDMVSMHNSIMNNKHIMQALRSLFTLQKCGSTDLSTREILNHPDFKKLCRQLRSQSGKIELNETIEALKVVSFVGVHSDSTIVQVLLQLVRHNINHLNLQQIIFMDFLLTQFKSSPLVDALKIALPMVFEIQLPVKMEYDHPGHLADYLFFAARNRLAEESVERIVNVLSECESEFDAKTAKSVVWSICDLEPNEFFRPLMKKAINSLVVHFDDLSYNDLETTLSKMIGSFSKRFDYFYDETFFDSFVNFVVDKDLGFKHSIYALRKLARVWYTNTALMDYMSTKVFEDPTLISQAVSVEIYSIAVSVSLTDYRPAHWDHLKTLISRTENLAGSDKREIIWIKFGSSLCLLGIYKLDVLNKCLNENFLAHLFKTRFSSDFENYCTIYQSIKLFKPELSCLLTPRFSPEILLKRYPNPTEFPLEAALQKGLGGDKYVKTDFYSKMGHHIDHVVLLRKGGVPVAINHFDEFQYVEDLEVPPENQLVVIKGLEPIRFTINKRRLKQSAIFDLQVLELKGYCVVPICLEVWESLPDFEKIPFLMQKIKEKVECRDLNVPESLTI